MNVSSKIMENVQNKETTLKAIEEKPSPHLQRGKHQNNFRLKTSAISKPGKHVMM